MRAWVMGAGALLLCSAGLAAAEEDAGAAVQRVVKAFGKLEGYKVEFKAKGGEAEGADHRVIVTSVDRTWSAEVQGGLCKLDGGAAWRPRAGAGQGAIKDSMAWKALLSTQEGALLDRLFVRPEEVLARVRALKGKARWAPPEEGAAPVLAAQASGDEPGEPTGKTGTREGKKKSKGESKDGPTASSHRVLIEGPPQTALDQFIALQNSGCMSGG